MKAWLRYTLSAILIAGFITGMVFLVRETRARHSLLKCTGLEVVLADDYRFVNEDDVRELILKRYGKFEGENLDSLDLARIEKMLDSQTAVLRSEAWVTDEGTLHVSVVQRKPEIRFLNGKDGFYVDATGYIFPLFERFTAACPLIQGPLPKDEKWIGDALELVGYMNNSWMERTDSIGVDGKGKLSLKVDKGAEVFFFGYPEDFQGKFEKMNDYCRSIRPRGNNYSKIDLTYTKQIVCR